MAAITSADVTYTEKAGSAKTVAGARSTGRQRVFTLAFGDGAKTYPTGGVPLLKASLGCPTFVKRLRVLAATPASGSNNPEFEWDGSETAPKLVAYVVDTTAASVNTQLKECANTVAPAAQSIQVEVEGY